MEKKSEIILLDLFSKKRKPVIEQLLRQKKINPQTLHESLRSTSIQQRKKTRNDLAKLVGVSPSALRIKKEKTKVPQKKNPDIPMLDLMKNVQHEGKQHQFETLHKLVHLNKDFYNAFKQSLDKRKKEIQSVVALCYFFDLTRRYPKNDFQPVVGVTLPLYVGGKKFGNVEVFTPSDI